MSNSIGQVFKKINLLTEIGIALSAEKNFSSLLEQILSGAKKITNADGGTIYLLNEDKMLEMAVVQTDSLNIHLGGNTNKPISFKPVELYDEQGKPNLNMVVTRAALEDKPINIADAYDAKDYDFSGTYEFDKSTGYHSQSFLAVPMKNHENDLVGVLQLINAKSNKTNNIVSFSEEDQKLAESLASLAAVAISNKQLIDNFNNLFNSLVKLIATAIDEKSTHTSGHCKRLPAVTMLLAEAANASEQDELKDFSMTKEDRFELEMAAWLHDCGKLTTPDFVMEKSTKLERIVDRIELVDLRLTSMVHEAEVEKLTALMNHKDPDEVNKNYQEKIELYSEVRAFFHLHNEGSEQMHKEEIAKVHEWANLKWHDSDGIEHKLLTENELENLCIIKGTLTEEERTIINNHIVATIKMLDTLPFPKHLQNVPEYAGGHHERVDGKGYPKGLRKDEMSVQARIMAIADVFEALTAQDRPYKAPMKLSKVVSILKKMSETGHIDPVLFDVFIDGKVHLNYAKEFLPAEQNDL